MAWWGASDRVWPGTWREVGWSETEWRDEAWSAATAESPQPGANSQSQEPDAEPVQSTTVHRGPPFSWISPRGPSCALYCMLCDCFLPAGAVDCTSERHLRRAQVWGPPRFYEQRRGGLFCRLCGQWAVCTHVNGKRHIKRAASVGDHDWYLSWHPVEGEPASPHTLGCVEEMSASASLRSSTETLLLPNLEPDLPVASALVAHAVGNPMGRSTEEPRAVTLLNESLHSLRECRTSTTSTDIAFGVCGRARADFDASEYGEEYISFHAGEQLWARSTWEDDARWAFGAVVGLDRRAALGWFPSDYWDPI